MKRFVHVARLFHATFFALVASCGCAMLREGNTVTTPDPKAFPCGASGDVCLDARTPDERCCKVGKCANDGAPYCDNRPPSDPSDPVTWSAKLPARLPRSAAK